MCIIIFVGVVGVAIAVLSRLIATSLILFRFIYFLHHATIFTLFAFNIQVPVNSLSHAFSTTLFLFQMNHENFPNLKWCNTVDSPIQLRNYIFKAFKVRALAQKSITQMNSRNGWVALQFHVIPSAHIPNVKEPGFDIVIRYTWDISYMT